MKKKFNIDKISYNSIKFSYLKNKSNLFSIGPLNFSIHKKNITFITGGNGSGKTTLLKLITGLYNQDSGTIIDSDFNEIKRDNKHLFRELFEVIWSDCFIFDEIPSSLLCEERFKYWLERLQIELKIKKNLMKL